jgi:hypothetical protein
MWPQFNMQLVQSSGLSSCQRPLSALQPVYQPSHVVLQNLSGTRLLALALAALTPTPVRIGVQVAASSEVQVVALEDVSAEREIELQKEDLAKKPEAIRRANCGVASSASWSTRPRR